MMNRPDGVQSARVVQVIETVSKRGLGTEKDPARMVIQYWDFEGKFLAEMDTEYCIPFLEQDVEAVKESIPCSC